ncbi:MAG: hypothetical protein IPN20_22710 [Haliscomenobacter sp.]|nr:hypothetical protein [Haliscomenobacter sp.]
MTSLMAKGETGIKIDCLKEIAKDYAGKLATPIYIGIRKGYLQNEEAVRALNGGEFVVDTPSWHRSKIHRSALNSLIMKTLLEVQFEGWTATPRMPFILSGNAICMATPTYSLLLGMIGCCLGRPVDPEEVRLGFRYTFDDTAEDVETRQRLINDNGKIIPHGKGTDAHRSEFHVNPRLIVWIDRLDWEEYFRYPIGAPTLGRSQDLLKIKQVQKVEVEAIAEAKISGCLLPFGGQLNSAGHWYSWRKPTGKILSAAAGLPRFPAFF